jgi:hypothetical protein
LPVVNGSGTPVGWEMKYIPTGSQALHWEVHVECIS